MPAGPVPPFAVPGSPENIQNGRDWMAFWRWLLDQRPQAMDVPELSPGGATISPMRPLTDPDDEGEARPPRVNKPPPKALEGAEPGREGSPGESRDEPSSLKGMRKLSEEDEKALQKMGEGAHDLKEKYGRSQDDLYVDGKGDIYVGDKHGSGAPIPTGRNVREIR